MSPEMGLTQLYLDVADVIIVAINREEIVTEINRKGCEILGYEKPEVLGKNWFEHFIPEETREEIKPMFHRMLEGTLRAEHYENPVLTRSGARRIISWHNVLVRDESGAITGTLSSGVDITQRKALEEELERYRERLETVIAERTAEFARANNELAREIADHKKTEEGLALRAAMLDHAREPILVLNSAGDFIYANQAAMSMYGFSREEWTRMNLRQLLPPDAVPPAEARLRAVFENRLFERESVHVCKDGSRVPVYVRLSIMKTLHGEFIIGVIRDLTRESGLRIVAEQMPGIIWTTDADLKLTASMGAGLSSIARKQGEGTGMALSQYLEESGFEGAVLAAHQQALAGVPVRFGSQNSKSGQSYQGCVAPLRNGRGEIVGTIGIAIPAER